MHAKITASALHTAQCFRMFLFALSILKSHSEVPFLNSVKIWLDKFSYILTFSFVLSNTLKEWPEAHKCLHDIRIRPDCLADWRSGLLWKELIDGR